MFLILGFTNRTSYSLSKYLINYKKMPLIIVDQKNTIQQQDMIKDLSNYGIIHNELGNQNEVLFEKYQITKIFISPGVPRSISFIQKAIALGIEILNDIEYFYQEFPERTYIGITGTDGKTTITTWLGEVISLEKPVLLVGNIGNPIFEYFDNQYNNHLFIVELSSFQLESINKFHPYIAIITNIHEDHLDRYKNFTHYAQTKKLIFQNQNSKNIALINNNDDVIKDFQKDINAQIVKVSINEYSDDWYYNNGIIYFCKQEFYYTKNLKVVGIHNIYNAMVVASISLLVGISEKSIVKGLSAFAGVEHRLEFVTVKKGINFYNDSKATTIQAMKLALQAFDKPVFLLAGGQSKGSDFNSLKIILKEKVKKVFLFGEMAEELATIWHDIECEKCNNLQDAFEKSLKDAQEQDIILLSPGGASFDEFSSYAHRGEFFMNLVHKLPD